MASTTKFPKTNKELAELGGGEAVRFPGTEEEYWKLAEEAEFRVDFYHQEIIAAMSYENEVHSDIVTEFMFLLKTIFREKNVRFGNSNRPVCIPPCGHAIFNPDGSVIGLPDKFYEYRPGMTAELTPIVLFEVLSKNTRVRDWGEKLPCFKQIPSLQYILYIDSEKVQLNFMERMADNEKWLESILASPEDTFDLAGTTLSLKDVYKGTLVK